jgi:methylated-DNA-[protein]-cysteine S-methyltransferase
VPRRSVPIVTATGFALFETALGSCAVAWNARGLAGVWLPESSDAQLRAGVLRRHPDAREEPPPAEVAEVVRLVRELLSAGAADFSEVRLDLDAVPESHRRVYAAVRDVPPGVTKTYGEIAGLIGQPGAAQVVGQAMAANPWPLVVPCHRVVAAGGGNGGFSAPGGVDTKLRLLAIEGATLF